MTTRGFKDVCLFVDNKCKESDDLRVSQTGQTEPRGREQDGLTLELKDWARARYLPTGDLLVVHDEPVGHGGRQLDGLQPEADVTFLQNLVVQAVFQRNNCKQRKRHEKIRSCCSRDKLD